MGVHPELFRPTEGLADDGSFKFGGSENKFSCFREAQEQALEPKFCGANTVSPIFFKNNLERIKKLRPYTKKKKTSRVLFF